MGGGPDRMQGMGRGGMNGFVGFPPMVPGARMLCTDQQSKPVTLLRPAVAWAFANTSSVICTTATKFAARFANHAPVLLKAPSLNPLLSSWLPTYCGQLCPVMHANALLGRELLSKLLLQFKRFQFRTGDEHIALCSVNIMVGCWPRSAGMLRGIPLDGNHPMSREEFERVRAMNGLPRNGSPLPAGLGPGTIGGLPAPFGPATAAALMAGRGGANGMLPMDAAAAMMPAGRINGMLPGLGAAAGVLPAHMAEQLRRQQQQQQQAGPHGEGWLAGAGVNRQGMAGLGLMPMPRPPPGQPAGLRQRIPGPGSRAADGSPGVEAPANRHAVHVWERDSQPGGLPLPPAGVQLQQMHLQQPRPAGPRPPQKLTPEELAKRKADLVGL